MVRLVGKNRERGKDSPYIEREAKRQSKAVKALERKWCEDSSKSPGSHGDCTFESRQRQPV